MRGLRDHAGSAGDDAGEPLTPQPCIKDFSTAKFFLSSRCFLKADVGVPKEFRSRSKAIPKKVPLGRPAEWKRASFSFLRYKGKQGETSMAPRPRVTETIPGTLGFEEVVRRLGVGRSSVHRWVHMGIFPQAVKDQRGRRRWSVQEVDAFYFEHQRSRVPRQPLVAVEEKNSDREDGVLLAKAIRFLRERPFSETSALDMAEEFSLGASTVERLLQEWSRLQGGIFLTGPQVRELHKFPLEGSWPVQTGADLIQNLRETSETLRDLTLEIRLSESQNAKKPAPPNRDAGSSAGQER